MTIKYKMQPVRGTKDLYGEDIRVFNDIISCAKKNAAIYGFGELSTPIFEFSEIYERNLGESSDIITKEVYKFVDRGNNFLTLRPEFTAGIVRAFISNGEWQQNLPQKFFSYGPIFRYDRPQKGRQRQFHQINFELIGVSDFLGDVEIIMLASHILEELGILQQTSLQINSLGCQETRGNYQQALLSYLNKYKDDLSADSKARLVKNPLRILDSKDKKDIQIIANAPEINSFYSLQAQENLDNILSFLDQVKIKYQINPKLVRGLDYYTGIVFEFVTDSQTAQNAVLAGGRYDRLIAKMGGNDVPAIGFAAGIERLMLLTSQRSAVQRRVSVIYISEKEQEYAVKLVDKLRKNKIYCQIQYGSNFKKQMKKASQLKSRFAVIIGENEVKSGMLNVKDFDSGKQEKIEYTKVIEFLKNTFEIINDQ